MSGRPGFDTDVLVVGAGPAGAAAATLLARRGRSVTLADRSAFPRDKVCGDALIPDSLAALERLALKDTVLRAARAARGVRIHAPDGTPVDLAGACACLPRAAFDDLLLRAAVEAGARFLPRHVLVAPLEHDGAVAGAAFRYLAGGARQVRARLTLLATGAAAGALRLFGVCRRVEPSAMAARVYLQADPALARDFDWLSLSYDRAICPGYGWIFPGPERVFNVGVGYFCDARTRPPLTDLRALLARFTASFPPAAALARHGRALGPLKGAPLRTALRGADLARPGLLVVGEAAGLTYSFSGEGIGKAMESGLLAAELADTGLEQPERGAPDLPGLRALARRYAGELQARFGARFRAYAVAQEWLSRPGLADFLARRARPGRFAHRQLEGLLDETADPRGLFSVTGLLRALVS